MGGRFGGFEQKKDWSSERAKREPCRGADYALQLSTFLRSCWPGHSVYSVSFLKQVCANPRALLGAPRPQFDFQRIACSILFQTSSLANAEAHQLYLLS